MNIAQIEVNLQKLIANINKETFIFDLLLAYGLPKASITRLQKGNLNMSKTKGEIAWKKKLFFKAEDKADLHLSISELAKGLKHHERFVIVTDYLTLLAIDTKTNDKLDCALRDLPKHYDFFLPWAGMEKAQHANENPADVKAAEKMARLFDVIKRDNPDDSPEFIHGLNVFLSRLLFCYFAEDTHIFNDSQFTNAIASHTQPDGSDVNSYLDKLFEVLNTPENERKGLPEYLNAFPFVNGGLFRNTVSSPKFSRSSRAALLSSGEQNWSAINPDIFGSMFQAVISADQRGNLGQHYTSVPNIMKVIEPLFLNELYEELEKATSTGSVADRQKKLKALLHRIHNIKIFDPACGSGNFLIIAYKVLRQLEMKIFKAGGMMALSGIQLSQFYGIEIDDFAGEIAKLALWLAEHQMNVEFYKAFGRTNPTLPLSEAGHIVQGNATRLNWEEVCPKYEGDARSERSRSEVYILGNPPYLGSFLQNKEQKSDLAYVCKGWKSYKDLDYIACWFIQGSKYIKDSFAKLAFVTTNSVSQGEQVILLWPYVFSLNIEILFAHQSFKWVNNARSNAGVYCSIIGLGEQSKIDKKIFSENRVLIVDNISPYLTSGSGNNTVISKRMKALSDIPKMSYGSKIVDGGHLIFSKEEKESLLVSYPVAEILLKRLAGSAEFIKGIERWCLYIEDENLEFAKSIPNISERLKSVQEFRAKSTEKSTREMAQHPHKYYYSVHKNTSSIIIPSTSSIRREYVPMGFLNGETIITNAANAIFDAEPWIFSILNSRIHMVWLRTVSGRLKLDYRYSSQLCYNTFPFPPISTQRKNEITQSVFRILGEREKHSDKTLAQLYDPDKMPDGLREAHRLNDMIIEKCYRSTPFTSDEERLEYLFKLYEKMIAEEKAREAKEKAAKLTQKK